MKKYIIAYIAITLASIGVFYVSTRGPQQPAVGAVGQPADIVLEDGRVISFDYTDDMTGETIEIYADRMVYSDSVSTAEAYIAMYVPAKQTVDFVSMLDAQYEIVKLETLTEQTVLVDVDEVWEIRCEDIVTATTTFEACNETLISSTPVYEDRYVATDVTSIIQSTLISDKDHVKLELKNAEGWYFARLTIQFAKEESEFFIEATGSKGDYGYLDPWFSSSWTYKKKIEINPDHVDATLTSFPVFVDLSDMGSDFFDNAKSDGCDIRVVESDDSTETAFELVDYDAGTDTGELHFLADSVSSSATTTFYMYYGNSGASCYAITDTYGAENVWSNYSAVWHMDSLLDSTANDFDLTALDSPTMGGVTGVVGSAVTLNGSTQSFYHADADALDPLAGDFTITAWANTDDYTQRTAVAYKGFTAGTNHWWGLTFEGSGFSNDNGWLMDDGADFDGARGGGGR